MSVKESIDMLIKNEEMTALLYKGYAAKFQEERVFWNDLAEEEEMHALWIKKFYNDNKDLIRFNDKRFKPELFEISFNYLSAKLYETNDRSAKITHQDALSIALGIETGMIERGFFKVFETDSAELKDTLEKLTAATVKHTNKIRNKLFK